MTFTFKSTQKRNRRKGQTLIEVTLIIPLLIVLVGAALDWGLVFFVSHVVQDSVREGARLAVTLNTPISGTTVRDEVRRIMPNTPLFADFRNNANIAVDACSGANCSAPPSCTNGTQPFIRVSTTGVFSFYFMRILGLSTTTITREAIMKYERNLTLCPTVS